MRKIVAGSVILFLLLCPLTRAQAASCEDVVGTLNARLATATDAQELVDILRQLNETNNKTLPAKFVTKRKARALGWTPGRSLWSLPALRGASLGGDRFGNYEKRLPDKKWREADLDYRGGRRGAKRLVFSDDGKRMITVDHYRTFTEVPPCR